MIEKETHSDRIQSVYTAVIKNMIAQINDCYATEEHGSSEVMFDCALVMIKEAAQIAVILEVPKEIYLTTCGEVFDVTHLAMADVVGSA